MRSGHNLLLLSTVAAFPQATGLDPDRLKAIPQCMQFFVNQGTAAGFVTILARHGQIAQLSAVGFQDLETKTPMRTDTIFQIASMTKPVTSVGILLLIDEGKLALAGLGKSAQRFLKKQVALEWH